MTIASTPKGAAVISDGVELGKTPLSLERPSADGTLHLTVRLDGYTELAMDVPANANVDRAVVLQKIEQPSAKKKTSGGKKKKSGGGTKTGGSGDRNDSVNPF
jgi:hypothetical protein